MQDVSPYLTDEELEGVRALVKSGRSIPAIIVKALFRRLDRAEGRINDESNQDRSGTFWI